MTVIPVVLIVTAAAALGAWLLLLWFKRVRRPVLIGFHVLLGVGSTETLVVFLHTSDLGRDSVPWSIAIGGLGCLAASILTGFSAPLFRNYRTVANSFLAAHVATGVAGFVAVLVLASRL